METVIDPVSLDVSSDGGPSSAPKGAKLTLVDAEGDVDADAEEEGETDELGDTDGEVDALTEGETLDDDAST